MTTGRELAEKALRDPMRSIGWRPRAAGWFTRQIADGFLGVIAVGAASKYCERGTALITLYVGIRDEANEELVSRLCGVKDGGYRQRTIVTSIGYLMPERRWREWLITTDNADGVASELAAAVEAYAESYLRDLPSDHALLLEGVGPARSIGDPLGLCRSVVYQAQSHGCNRALAYLDKQVAAVGYWTEVTVRVRDWLAPPDPATGTTDRDV